jgi:hypothetical protein
MSYESNFFQLINFGKVNGDANEIIYAQNFVAVDGICIYLYLGKSKYKKSHRDLSFSSQMCLKLVDRLTFLLVERYEMTNFLIRRGSLV